MSRLVALLALTLFACSASSGGDDDDDGHDPTPDAPGASCASLSGTWVMGGTCGSDGCVVTQVGCAITQIDCSSGAHSTTGTIDGNRFSYTGESGGGAPATCSGVANGDEMSGTCSVTGFGTCSFSGDRR